MCPSRCLGHHTAPHGRSARGRRRRERAGAATERGQAVKAIRSTVTRLSLALAVVCGIIGLVAGMTGHNWKLGPIGWFTGGTLLAAIALFGLIEGAIDPVKPKQ